MYCVKCGAELQKGQDYCKCGQYVRNYTDIKKYNELPKILKNVCIGSVIVLFGCIISHFTLYLFDELDKAVTFVQWIRFAVVLNAYIGFECIILEKEGSKRAKALTALAIIGVSVVAMCFLLPSVSGEFILQQMID